jgi:AraC-like DNA-binding protein
MSVVSFDIHVLVYLILSLKLIKKYIFELENNFSTIEKIDLKWLKLFIIIFLIGWYLGTFRFVLSHFIEMDRFIINLNVLLSRITTLILSVYVVFKALKHPKIFTGIEEKSRYQKSNLDEDTKNQILGKLKAYIKEAKPYLKHTLTLNDLAEQLELSAKYLSQVINECLSQNFYDFINSHRVDEAKARIEKYPQMTFLEILHDAGFNSKAVFNNAFKKHSGMTPSEYKNSPKNIK